MRRILAMLFAMLLAAFVLPGTALGGEKVDVCHAEGNGSYHLINISENAFPKHLEHGDASPGDPVPGMDGFVFGDDCIPVEAATCDAPGTISGTVPSNDTLGFVELAVPGIGGTGIGIDFFWQHFDQLNVPYEFNDGSVGWTLPADFYLIATSEFGGPPVYSGVFTVKCGGSVVGVEVAQSNPPA